MVEEMYREETSNGELDSNLNSNTNFSSENVAKKMKTIDKSQPVQFNNKCKGKDNDSLQVGLQDTDAIVQADCTTTGGGGDVSLTLGLQHREGELPSTLSDGNDFHRFMMENDESADYGYIDIPDNRSRFEPSQLLHDFVA